MSAKPLPGVQVFAIADHVYQDAQSRKMILAGIFNNWNASRLPVQVLPFSVYLRLTDVVGPLRWCLRLVWLKDSSNLAEFRGETEASKERLLPRDIIVRILGMQFEHAGAYALQFFVHESDAFVKELRINVTLPKDQDASG